MGFLTRFFSIRGRKSKKQPAVVSRTESLVKPCQVDDTEAAVTRLLRSSSGRVAEESQMGPSSLPPLPHPIDLVIPQPKSSSTTVASVRSTYSVIIRSRTVHSRTEFPNAYPPMHSSPKRSLTDSPRRRSKSVPITPRDKSRLLSLRQDPSVASLLNHYDDQGHLNSALFSNTPSPQKEECVQRRRTGSTLRQLLGHPSSPVLGNPDVEGDISWAEKFLGETDGNSSQSSIGPLTPVDTHFTLTHTIDDKPVPCFDCDTSTANHQTFSSLEVELSVSTDAAHPQVLNSPHGNSTTPQRASEIFNFLGDKRRANEGPISRLPQLKTTTPNYRRFSAESPISDSKPSYIPLPRRSSTHIPQLASHASQRSFSLSSDASMSPPASPTTTVFWPPQPEDVEPTVSQAAVSKHIGQCIRGPRGPRLPSKIPSRQSTGRSTTSYFADDSRFVTEQHQCMQPMPREQYMDVEVTRPREMHSQIPKLRNASGSSSGSVGTKQDPIIHSPCQHPLSLQPGIQTRPRSTDIELLTGSVPRGKENDMLSRLPQPITPVRLFGLQSHLRELPSPVSSSELSPVAKQMMDNVRQQRLHARQRERQAGRLGSSQSRIRY